MIENIRWAGLTREVDLRLYRSTFGPDDEHAEACLPCVEAILGAAHGG